MTFVSTTTLINQLTAFFASRGVDVYVVGGTVRDWLLGRDAGADIDLAVRGDAVKLGRELASELHASLAPLSVPRGMMRVVLPPVDGDDSKVAVHGRMIDLSGYTGDIEGDLARRDFTINAMGVRLSEWDSGDFGEAIIDPFGGRVDLARKTLRSFNAQVFEDDPGRLLRAVTAVRRTGDADRTRYGADDRRPSALREDGLSTPSTGRVSADHWHPVRRASKRWRQWTGWGCWSISSRN